MTGSLQGQAEPNRAATLEKPMDIRVSGHQVDTGESLRARVEDRMSGIADKYLSRAISAHVTFGKGPHDFGFTCEIVAFFNLVSYSARSLVR